jgi:hypothetical protein
VHSIASLRDSPDSIAYIATEVNVGSLLYQTLLKS